MKSCLLAACVFAVGVLVHGQTQPSVTIRFISPTDDTYVSGQVLLKVAIDGAKRPGLKDSASLVALAISHKLGDTPETAAMLKEGGIERPSLEIIKAEYGSGRKQQDVTDIVRKQLDGTTHLKNLFLCGTDQGFVGIIGAITSGISIANRHALLESP